MHSQTTANQPDQLSPARLKILRKERKGTELLQTLFIYNSSEQRDFIMHSQTTAKQPDQLTPARLNLLRKKRNLKRHLRCLEKVLQCKSKLFRMKCFVSSS